jgi:hypothetical protein
LIGPTATVFQLAPLKRESVGALVTNLLRNRYLPLLMRHWSPDALSRAELLVVIAPTATFAAAELAQLRAFVETGGQLLICAGWEERGEAVESLLHEFELSLLPVPLGAYPIVRREEHLRREPQFINAWPVSVRRSAEWEAIRAQMERFEKPTLLPPAEYFDSHLQSAFRRGPAAFGSGLAFAGVPALPGDRTLPGRMAGTNSWSASRTRYLDEAVLLEALRPSRSVNRGPRTATPWPWKPGLALQPEHRPVSNCFIWPKVVCH